MADWRELLEEVLGPTDASASALDAEARQAAERILLEASASHETEALLHELDRRFPMRANGGALIPLRAYLRGRSLLHLDREAEALNSLLPSCEKLEQQARWADLAALADEILQQTPRIEAARYLAKAVEQGGFAVAPAGSLQRAYEMFSDEHRICWLVAEDLERAGETDRALGLYIGCLPSLIETRQRDRIEEVFLRLDELDDPETVATLLDACIKLASLKEWALAETYLEPLLPKIKKAGLAPEAWVLFLKLLPKAPAETNLRRFLMDIAPQALPDVNGILDLLSRSGILDPKVKVETAQRHLKELLEFAPGYRVMHQSWGAGRIRAHEGDSLIIDFADRPGHRMSLALSRNALKVIAADDLRVLIVEHPEKVQEMIRQRPADLAYLAIRELGGRTTTQDLRRRLTGGGLLTTTHWNTWWKEARRTMEQDDRFDLSEGFRQTYAIRARAAAQGDEDLLLPRLDRRRGVRANLNLLRRFLDQHPGYQELASRMYTPVLVRWLRDEHTNPEAAMAICLLLHRWSRLDRDDLKHSLESILAVGGEAAAFADESDQRFMIEQAFTILGLETRALLFALGSRYPVIRTMALERLERDPGPSEALLAELLNRPEERPHAAFTVIWMVISEDEAKPAFLPSPWIAAIALLHLVERGGRDIVRNQALRLFSPNSALARALHGRPAPDEVRVVLRDALMRWRESERFLFPILAFFEQLGMEDLTGGVRGDRSAATNRFLRTTDSPDAQYSGTYVTRHTRGMMEQERDQLAWELKNTVPEAIRRAREMGDLSENAEYDAAKDKQAKFAQRIGSINELLSKATLIENVRVPEGEVGPGSCVEIRWVDREPIQEFWLLGDRDSDLDATVVSCSSPIARGLLGRKVGDQVEVDLPTGKRVGKILSSRQRMPEAPVQR
ncbi:MAG: GreA/GreB family elongation factor [Candidatus Eisenbacteria bacterium]